MTQRPDPTNKMELLATMDASWRDLWGEIARHGADALTNVRDAAGWSAKDHLYHLAKWEHAIALVVRDGRPQHETLGIDEDALRNEVGFDTVNAMIDAQGKNLPLTEVETLLRDVHAGMVDLVEQSSEADLQRPFSEVEPGGRDIPIMHAIDGDTWSHFDDHRVWISELFHD